jgi:hypothetical protein
MWPFLLRHKWIIAYLIIIVAIIASLFITGWIHSLPPSWGMVAIIIAIVGFIITYFSTLERSNENTEIEVKSDTKPEEVVFAPSPKIEVIHKIEPAEEPESSTVPTPPSPYFAHPYPMQKNFTGREQERQDLTDWFQNNPHPIFAYIAIGGMGKSALVWYWLQEDVLNADSSPEGIIWWSFYEKEKEAGFEHFLDHAIAYTSSGKTNPKEIPSTRDKMDTLYSLLSQKNFLLVFDGVERVLRAYAGMGSPYQGDAVKEDEREDYRSCIDPHCSTFLQMLPGVSKSKILLTSRLFPRELDDLEGCLRRDLTQMAKADAVDFFRRQGVKGTRAEIEEACGAYDYHPLSLRLLSGMIVHDMKYNGDVKAWTRHNPLPKLVPKEHHILDLAYNSLNKQKQTFISKLAAFRSPRNTMHLPFSMILAAMRIFMRLCLNLPNEVYYSTTRRAVNSTCIPL